MNDKPRVRTLPRTDEEKGGIWGIVGSSVIALLLYAWCTSFATPVDPDRKRFIDEAVKRGGSAYEAAELWDRLKQRGSR